MIATILSALAGALLRFIFDPITRAIERAHYADEGKKEQRLNDLEKRIASERVAMAARAASVAADSRSPDKLRDDDGFRRD